MEKIRYFLGSNSPRGFYGYFQNAYGPDWKVWLIKGGPGCGKSTLMGKAAEMAGGTWEYIHCSSDPKSLDAIINAEKKLMVADATAPHTMDPRHPGCVEQIINMGEGFDTAVLREMRAEVVHYSAINSEQHKKAVHYLAAAASVKKVQLQTAESGLMVSDIRRLAADWCDRKWQRVGKRGSERRRGLSAVTPEGILFYDETVAAQADTVYLLQDDWGLAAPCFLNEIRSQLLQKGYAMTVCYCSLFPETCIEHILLPEQRVAFVTANSAHTISAAHCCTIDLGKSYSQQLSVTELQQLQSQQKDMISAAAQQMFQARKTHDLLEKCYSNAMDFSFAEQKAQQLGQWLYTAVHS